MAAKASGEKQNIQDNKTYYKQSHFEMGMREVQDQYKSTNTQIEERNSQFQSKAFKQFGKDDLRKVTMMMKQK